MTLRFFLPESGLGVSPVGRTEWRGSVNPAGEASGLLPGTEGKKDFSIMRIFFSVGEPSGDLHAANLIRDLRRRDPGLEFHGFAGPGMQALGCQSLFDLTQLPIMWFADAIRNLRTFQRLKREAAAFFDRHTVDAVVLIDYPGFNWHIARLASEREIPVFYYGVPQMWAWAPWRIGKLRRTVDHVLCKLPFEAAWFAKRNVQAHFVGHPFYDEVARQEIDPDFVARMAGSRESPLLLILPGSRNREVDRHWPLFREAAAGVVAAHPGTRIAVGCFSVAQREQVQRDVDSRELPIDVFTGRTPELIRAATCAMACSGSVSLELLAARLPTVIAYHLTGIQHFLAARFLRCRHITLVNLMALEKIERDGRPLFDPDLPDAADCPMPEYLTSGNRSASIAGRISGWLADPRALLRRRQWLDQLASQYAIPGASDRAAGRILDQLRPAGSGVRAAA